MSIRFRSFRQAVGFLKVGWKHLLLLDGVQRTHEMTVLCALDFFVQQKHRRMGYGKKLFDWLASDLVVDETRSASLLVLSHVSSSGSGGTVALPLIYSLY